ncbi:MAG: hypothetical protein M3370_13425 [Actinomycetota bacterium]|nr:hypothetical protein [Actinomycetota bacterium]
MHYSGRVTSGPLPKGGKIVVVQGRVRGGSWQTFATRQARGRGRFSGRYRLRVRRPGTRLQFRVRVPSEGNYPYLTAVGRPVTKTVR